MEVVEVKRNVEYFRGCLLGGAIGDALGAPVEFLKFDEIKRRFGDEGITDLILSNTGKAEITDDTQLTMFTAEGILNCRSHFEEKGVCHLPTMVFNAYQRWLYTQERRLENGVSDSVMEGWLLKIPELYNWRSPGNTCLSALMTGKFGTMDKPINNSKGCGGVMRVAPIGLFFPKEQAFQTACECAALTHGHPSGYLSAGVLAHIIASIIEGMEIGEAVEASLIELQKYKGHEECTNVIKKAIDLATSDIDSISAIKQLGEGWVGDEAIAISIYCALKYSSDFKKALCVAVNHDGDSDSTGAITGNMLGAYLGVEGVPKEWIEKVELSDVLAKMADDLIIGYEDIGD